MSRSDILRRLALAGMLGFSITGCGGGGGSTSGGGGTASTTSPALASAPAASPTLSADPVASPSPAASPTPQPSASPQPVPSPASSTRTFRVPGLASGQLATLILRNVGSTGLSLTSPTSARELSELPAAPPAGARDLAPELVAAQQQACRQAALQLRQNPHREAIRSRFQALAQGAPRDFMVGAAGTIRNVTCQKMLPESQTQHCTVFAEVTSSGPVLTLAQAQLLAAAWDTDNPFKPGDGIYNQVRGLFGREWSSNPTGGADGDTKVNLVCLSSASIGSPNLYGYFNPGDEFPSSEIPSSNQGEILYLNADKASGDEFDLLATATHEFQHMVDWNMKVGRDGLLTGDYEETTLNEGKSVLCEDLLGYGLTASGGGNAFLYQTTLAYLRNTTAAGLLSFDSSASAYGRGYMLMRYLTDRFGVGTLTAIATSPGIGLNNVSATVGVPFQSLFDDWTTANLVSGLANAPARFSYGTAYSPRGSYTVRGLGSVTLPGVLSQSTGALTRTVESWTALYSDYPGSGSDLNLTVNLSNGEDANLVVQAPKGTFGGFVPGD